jgi:hypothetical protein
MTPTSLPGFEYAELAGVLSDYSPEASLGQALIYVASKQSQELGKPKCRMRMILKQDFGALNDRVHRLLRSVVQGVRDQGRFSLGAQPCRERPLCTCAWTPPAMVGTVERT